MSGFPARISRAALGPTREDLIPATTEKHTVSARFFELTFRQVVGVNLLSALAGGLVVSDALASHEEAWNPNGGAAPTFTKEGTGHYRAVYPATVKDLEGNDVSPGLTRARAFPQSAASLYSTATVTDGRQVDVYVYDEIGDNKDGDVWFEAF